MISQKGVYVNIQTTVFVFAAIAIRCVETYRYVVMSSSLKSPFSSLRTPQTLNKTILPQLPNFFKQKPKTRLFMTYRTVRIGVAYRLGTLASADFLLGGVNRRQNNTQLF